MATRTKIQAPKDETEFKCCECGCSLIVNPKRHFAPGHDQRHKGVLLRRFDEGDTAAAVELTERGWRSEAELADRKEKVEKREQARAAREAKAELNRKAKEEASKPAARAKEVVKSRETRTVKP